MAGTYKLVTLVGTSKKSVEDAIEGAIHEASLTLRGISWFEVLEVRGRVAGGSVEEFQVTMRAGFRVEAEIPTPTAKRAKK